MRLRKQILLCFKAPQSSRSFDKRKIIDLYFIRMKYVIVLGDGMADEYIASISGTPLEKANIENARKLAKTAKIGLVKTVPDGFKPASDVANLAVLGYSPEKYYSGRSPLEALSIGVDMKDTDVAYRMNLVTLSTEKKLFGQNDGRLFRGRNIDGGSRGACRAHQKTSGNGLPAFLSGRQLSPLPDYKPRRRGRRSYPAARHNGQENQGLSPERRLQGFVP